MKVKDARPINTIIVNYFSESLPYTAIVRSKDGSGSVHKRKFSNNVINKLLREHPYRTYISGDEKLTSMWTIIDVMVAK